MTADRLQLENEELRRQLEEAQETIQAIRTGAVDAFVVEGADGHQVYTLEGADRPYRKLVEQMQQGAVTLDAEGSIAYCNVRFAELVGVPHERLIGIELRDFVPASEQVFYERVLQQGRSGSGQGETALQKADGSAVPVLLSVNALPADTGVALGVLVTDLTTQRHQEKLNAALELLRVTLASIGDAVITTDNSGRVDYLNDVAQKLTGWTGDEAKGKPLEFVFQTLNEQTRQPIESLANRALREGRIDGLANHTVLVAKDGTEYPIDDSAAPIRDRNGDVLGAVMVFRDVSERREAEELLRQNEQRYRTLFNSIDEGLCVIEMLFDDNDQPVDYRFLEVNPVFEKQSGLSNTVGKRIRQLVPDHEQNWFDFYGEVALGGQPKRFVNEAKSLGRWFDVYAFRLGEPKDRRVAVLFTDITQRKRAAEELKEARSRLESTLTAGEVGTWEYDAVHDVVRADENLRRMFGITREDAAGGPLALYTNLIHPDDQPSVQQAIADALSSGESFEATYRLLKPADAYDPEKTVRWVVARGRVERDESGLATRLPGVIVDVTAQRQAQQDLRAVDARLQLALKAGRMGTWDLDIASGKLTCSETCKVNFGRHAGDRFTYDDFAAAVLDEDRSMWRRVVKEAVTAATDFDLEYRVRWPDGSIHWVFVRASCLADADGRTFAMSGVSLNIDERKRSEEQLRESEARFRQLADAIPQLAWTAGPDGEIDWFNDRWYAFTGTSLEQMRGWGWQSVHDPDVLPTVIERWNESLASGEPFEMVFPLRSAEGSFHTFLTIVMPFHDAQGRIVRWFGTNTDISEQQKMQDELRRIATELSESDRRKDEFLATLAHELRNPLSPIKTATQLMQMITDDVAQFRELSGIIDRQVVQMVRLIDDLLDVSRISRGKITLQTEPCDLRDIISSALEAAKPFIKNSGQSLHVDNSDEALLVLGDSARLSQVVVNLLNNAAKYTPAAGDIWLSARGENDHAMIQVRDNGVGIPASHLSTVFEMFQQVDVSKERGQAGLGIGLSLVENLVKLHHGHVTVESGGRGCGSLFTVQLPLLKGHPAKSDSGEKVVNALPSSRSFRVLVVEDIRANRFMLVRLLKTLGHQVAEAIDGNNGIEAALAFQPEVIFSDISMPNMNGHEMAKKIREIDQLRGVILVALTGYGQVADRQNAMASGFDNHMVKPVDVAALARFFAELSAEKTLSRD